MPSFAQRMIAWHRHHGRHDLPWQQTRDPYRVWLSEIMLQQTQVATVVAYYVRFLARFPTLTSLAAAEVDAVMPLWSGLGYYARARNLHACARVLANQFDGSFPRDPATIATLPGIGRSTANAIAVFCFDARAPILDGNVKRLLCRYRGIAGYPGRPAVEKSLWQIATELLPTCNVATYIQAQMDLGATVCTRSKPRCGRCPVADECIALRDGRTAALPAPRPKKILPEKSLTVLVLRNDGHVLVETRPPSGIWGGLQSLPELPAGQEISAYCQYQLGMAVDAVLPAPTFVHAFTHFRLTIRPFICKVRALPAANAPGRTWVRLDALAEIALPAPVRRLLEEISATP